MPTQSAGSNLQHIPAVSASIGRAPDIERGLNRSYSSGSFTSRECLLLSAFLTTSLENAHSAVAIALGALEIKNQMHTLADREQQIATASIALNSLALLLNNEACNIALHEQLAQGNRSMLVARTLLLLGAAGLGATNAIMNLRGLDTTENETHVRNLSIAHLALLGVSLVTTMIGACALKRTVNNH